MGHAIWAKFRREPALICKNNLQKPPAGRHQHAQPSGFLTSCFFTKSADQDQLGTKSASLVPNRIWPANESGLLGQFDISGS